MFEQQRDLWFLPAEKWNELYAVELQSQTAEDTKKGKFKAQYIPYHVMMRELRSRLPGVIPVLVDTKECEDEEDFTVLLVVALWDSATKTHSMLHYIPVMQHGASRHDAITNPNARQISDSIRRAFCRVIAEETGLGYFCWHDYDPYETTTASTEKPASKKKEPKFEDLDDDDYDDDSLPFDSDLDDDDDDDDDESDVKPAARRYVPRRGGRR